MLRKENRLQKDRDFKRLFKNSRPFKMDNLVLRFSENRLSVSRVGFIISNKIHKHASRRNALKRQLRASMFGLLPNLKKGLDMVLVVVRDFSFPYDNGEIRNQLENILKRNGLLK